MIWSATPPTDRSTGASVCWCAAITSSTFGGDRLDEIYVTSMARVKHPAVHDMFARELKPQFGAGHLFKVSGLGIRGLPEPRFAG